LTIIVGIKCEEGIVIAGDTRVTMGILGQQTTKQDIPSKIEIPDGHPIILGFSGHVGLSQKIKMALTNEWGGIKGGNHLAARNRLRDVMWAQIGPELEHGGIAARVVGAQVAQQTAICVSLVALPIQGKPTLLSFDQQCAAEEVTLDLPFISIGSGAGTADPFVAFVKEALWADRAPKTVHQGTLGAIWTLDYVIGKYPGGGIGGEITIGRLYEQGGKWVAELVGEDLIAMHRQNIREATGKLSEYLISIKKDG